MQYPACQTAAVGDGLTELDATGCTDVERDGPVEAFGRAHGEHARRKNLVVTAVGGQLQLAQLRRGLPVGLTCRDLLAQLGVLGLQCAHPLFLGAGMRNALDEPAHRAQHGVGTAVERAEAAADAGVGRPQAGPAEVEGDETRGDDREHDRREALASGQPTHAAYLRWPSTTTFFS
jgi:hypothetical protein